MYVAAKLRGAECKKGHAKDSALDDIKRRHRGNILGGVNDSGGGDGGDFLSVIFGGGGAFSIEPNLVKHIGFYSTLRKSATVNPFTL